MGGLRKLRDTLISPSNSKSSSSASSRVSVSEMPVASTEPFTS